MEKGYRTGLFLTENKENGGSVHGIVLNNSTVNSENYTERVLLSTPIDFMFSYRTGLNFIYTVDITDTILGKLYMETYTFYREYTQNLLKAQEILRDTGNILRAVQVLLPNHFNSVEYTENENGSYTVWVNSSVEDKTKSKMNSENDCKYRLMFLNLNPDGTWTEVKTPKEYLDDISVDEQYVELIDMLYSMITDTMGDSRKDFRDFIEHMNNGINIPKTNADKSDGAIIRVSENSADLLIDDTYRVRVSYHTNKDGKSFKREPKALVLWDGSSMALKVK